MRAFIIALLTLGSTTLVMADSQAPSTVNNVQASVLNTTSIRVSWNKPWDDTGVAGYNVYRNGVYFRTVSSTNFLDSEVSAGNRYEYSIVAFDDARNFSSHSGVAAATTGDSDNAGAVAAPPAPNGSALAAPGGLRAEVLNGNQAKIIWNPAAGNPNKYNVYRDNVYLATVGSTEYTDRQLNYGTDYRYQIVAIRDDQFSSKSSEFIVNTANGSSSQAQNNVVRAAAPQQPQNDGNSSVPAGYRLVFNDEFRGSSLDTSKWNSSYRWGPNWIINGEKQYYIDRIKDPDFGHSPFEFDGENMTITASRTPDHLRGKANNQPYLSGALTTYNKFRMRYGYVEMRARLPRGKGLWSAFWLLHQNEADRRPEIDVVEYIGDKPNVAYQTYHYYENWNLRSTPTMEASGPDYSQDFHTYGVKWEPGRITWYVDGQATNTFSNGNVSWEDMYLLVNLALGGWWAGDPDGSTPFPARMTIDYIRAYQP